MGIYSDQHSVLENDLFKEQVKQIVLNHFYSYYIRKDITEMMRNVGAGVRWIGSKEHFVAHDREEYDSFMRREVESLPKECVMKVVSMDVAPMAPGCFLVSGELELRMPYQEKLTYSDLRFTVMVMKNSSDHFEIVSVHTSVGGEGLSEREVSLEEGQPGRHMVEDIEKRRGDDFDALTGVYTLDAFKKELGRMMGERKPDVRYALIATDVSHFEKVNNLYGLKRGDQILLELANMLTTCSKSIQLCCRSVAEHFFALVCYRDRAELKLLLKNLCLDFEKKISGRYSDARPRLGIGVYLMDQEEKNVGRMVECANLARKNLRFQKGSPVTFYDAKVFRRLEKVRKIERSMREAMENGEFKVFLQPKYELGSGEIVGAEALVRWIRRDGSMVYPDEFIPVFEKNGYIAELDFFMLEKVCEMLQRRIKAKRKCVSVSVNQSRVLLQDREYTSKVASVLARYNTPPQYIELELTERIFSDNLEEMAQIMQKLKDLGLRWSIDDFGTGYSSLNLLKELPVDIIKIDKSFLEETESSRTSKIIVRKTVELTKELEKVVVCEGVETESQADYLKGIQCDVAQGYLYAKPMPMIEFEKMLDKEMYS